MKTYKYKSYDEYVKAQKAAYKKKFDNVWAKEKNIKAIAEYLQKRNPKHGLCHGVRQGYEVEWFRKYLKIENIIGTDIGKPTKDFILQHDFNKPLCLSDSCKYDFIYSNSFDHAYDPEQTFNIWCDQVKHNGVIILEYDRRQEHTGEISLAVNKTDPVSIKFAELIKLIPKWNKNATVIDILDMPVITQKWRKAVVIEVG